MDSLIVVEVINDEEEIVRSETFSNLPFMIGRAYHCDLRIEDPHVCAEHVQIRQVDDEIILIENLSEVNGLFDPQTKTTVESLAFNESIEVRIGLSTLRISRAPKKVPKAIPLSPLHFRVKRPRIGIGRAIGMFCFFITLFYVKNYMLGARSGSNQQLTILTKGLLGALGLFIPWAAAWALVGKITIKKFRYPAHLTISMFLVSIFMILSTLCSYLEFAFGSPFLGTTSSILAFGCCCFALISLHIFYASRVKRRKRWSTSAIFTITFLAIFAVMEFEDSFDFSTKLPLSASIKPPWLRLVGGVEPAEFASGMDSLRLKLEVD